jgi:hypothetical protein
MCCLRLAAPALGQGEVDSCLGKHEEGRNLYFVLQRKHLVQACIPVVVLLVVCLVSSFVEEWEVDTTYL